MKHTVLALAACVSFFLTLSEDSRADLLGMPAVIASGVQPEHWVHAADMDETGRGSILYSPQPGVLHLLRQNQGSYAPAQALISSGVARVLGARTADFNGNGHRDIAVALELPNGQFAIRVLYWTIFGAYLALDPDYLPGGVPAPQAPLEVADLDRDGRTDIVTCWRTSATGTAKGRTSWFRNLGGNDFSGANSLFLATFDAPCALAVEDFNRDGAPDIAVADNARSEVRVFPGPDFLGPATLATVGPPLRILVEHNGADRWPDLLVLSGGFDTLNNQSIRLYANVNGVFTGGSTNLANPVSHAGVFLPVDLNRDGLRDFVAVSDNNATRGLLVTINDGSPVTGFTYQGSLAPDPLRGGVAFDDDLDGDEDIIAVTGGALVRFANTFAHRLALSRRQYRYGANNGAPQPVSVILAVDVNGDGRNDAVTGSAADGSVRVYFNTAGQLTAGPVVATKPGVRYLASGDLDRDGDVDLVLQSLSQNRVIWYENNGSGTAWTEHVIPNVISIPTGVAVGDINGDGQPDIIVASAGTNTIHLLANTGNAQGWSISNAASVVDAGFIRITDVIRGGAPEVVVQRGDSGVVLLSYANGWTSTVLDGGTAGASGLGLAVADFSGDGRADIAFGSGIAAWILVQQANGTFSSREALGVGFDFENSVNVDNVPRSLQAADLDGDGVCEVIATFRYSGMVFARSRPESGRQSTMTPFLTNAATEPGDTAPLDLDGDGLADLVRRESQNSRLAIDLTTAIHHYVSVRKLPAYGDTGIPYNVLTQSLFGMLQIEARNFAWPGDGDVPLTGLRLTFLQNAAPFAPLAGNAVQGIFEGMSLHRDLGAAGTFDPQSDPAILGVATPAADATGTIVLALPSPTVLVPPGAASTFLLAAQTSPSSGWNIQATVPGQAFIAPDSNKPGYATGVLMANAIAPFAMRSQSPTTLQSWRYFYFFDPYSQGRAANEFDFDRDGLPNLIEYCLGTNPKIPTPSPFFDMQLSGSNYLFVFAAAAPWMPGGKLTLVSSTNLVNWAARATRSGGQAWTTSNLAIDEVSFDADRNAHLVTVPRKAAESFRLQADEVAP